MALSKPKNKLAKTNSEYENKRLEDNEFNDISYSTVERNQNNRRYNQTNEMSDMSSSQILNKNKRKSPTTPSRYVKRKIAKIFSIDPEAFEQPTADEQENLIVNLEDIVKEEHTIFNIQE
jgi:hypothetical protein